jgi:hypothetical protein
MNSQYEKNILHQIIQSLIYEKIHSIDNVYESAVEQERYINIEYTVRVMDKWTFPKSHRISINDYISISRQIKLDEILDHE